MPAPVWWRARLADARGGAGAEVEALARDALVRFRGVGAAWWIAQSIEVLERLASASPEERLEREVIEQGLRGVSSRTG